MSPSSSATPRTSRSRSSTSSTSAAELRRRRFLTCLQLQCNRFRGRGAHKNAPNTLTFHFEKIENFKIFDPRNFSKSGSEIPFFGLAKACRAKRHFHAAPGEFSSISEATEACGRRNGAQMPERHVGVTRGPLSSVVVVCGGPRAPPDLKNWIFWDFCRFRRSKISIF